MIKYGTHRQKHVFVVDFEVRLKPVFSATKTSKYIVQLNLSKRATTNGSLMKVEDTFDLHQAIISLVNQFLVFFLSGCLRQALLYIEILHLAK